MNYGQIINIMHLIRKQKIQSVITTYNGRKITIHYNPSTGAFDDFKFKN